MSENASMFTQLGIVPQSLLDLSKDSAALAAQLTSVAIQADDRNMHHLRAAIADLAVAFAKHSHTLLDLCIAGEKEPQNDKASH